MTALTAATVMTASPIPFDTVFGAMVGVHALIGIGEGVITAAAVSAVLASRSDLLPATT